MTASLADRVRDLTLRRLFMPRRVGVCGSSKGLPSAAVPLCRAIGVALARCREVVIVSGGARKRRAVMPDDLAVDWHIVSAALEELRRKPALGDEDKRIETVSIDASTPSEKFVRGASRRARGRTHEARRFSFVADLDAVIAVGGSGGTAQSLALAAELGLHVLPIPLAGGEAEELWHEQRASIIERLRIDEATARRWEGQLPEDEAKIVALATEMVTALIGALPRRCFVIMPYGDDLQALYVGAIEPALEAAGDIPNRLDVTAAPGHVWQQIHDGIRYCDYAIGVLDGERPNVLYELGMAHAFGKPTIILHRVDPRDPAQRVPFDISMHQRLEYVHVDETLMARILRMIGSLRTLGR